MLLLSNKTIDKLKYDLVRDGFISLENLTFAQEKAEQNSLNLAEILIKENFISEDNLLNFIQDKLHIPYVNLNDYTPDIECLKYLNFEDAKKYNILPLFKIEDVLTIAMSDPLDLFSMNNLFHNDISIEPVVSTENSIKEAIEKYYISTQNFVETSWQDVFVSANFNDNALKTAVHNLIANAISEKKMHIHMERNETGLNIYYDREFKGFIPNIAVPRFLFELQNYIKGVDINSDLEYGSGKFDFIHQNNTYSVLISFLPTKYGKRYSLEINEYLQNIENLGFSKEVLSLITEKPAFIGLQNNNCCINYCLAKYFSTKFSILMIENVVKYDLPMVCQIETQKNTGLYFDEILRQTELQNFDMIFWEKIYSQEQFEKLKLLSKERIIITSPAGDNIGEFDFVIYPNGKIK